MPVDPRAPIAGKSGKTIDVFLAITTKRAGKIKGEASPLEHKEEIIVDGYSWGVSAASALGSSQATGRRSYRNLTVVKNIDSATTSLMSVLATNDEVKEAKLAMRKAGGGQRDYFTITLSNARVVSVDIECGADGNAVETIAISFSKVQVDYEVQQSLGGRGAGFSFTDEILPN
jgi:type VI secretion system secreted protein Hcp